MARRSGQNGYIERKGNAYYVRFRIDVPGREKRAHKSVRLCPASGPGKLTKPERQRRAKEIIARSGADTEAHFTAALSVNLGGTFRSQAKKFIEDAKGRKRKPVKPATASTWEYALDKWLLPHLGDFPLAKVDNDTVKPLVGKMYDAGLTPKTIENYVGLVKLVVKSAKERGRELFPRTWSKEEMDIPEIEKQHRPYFTAEIVTAILSQAAERERVLYSLLAGTGLRVGEALGLELRDVSSDGLTLDIRQSLWHTSLQAPKTKNAIRKVHLCRELADLLKRYIANRTEGFLFPNAKGKPLSQRNVLARSLHPILEEKLRVAKQGFHGFRRFRMTWLRKNRVPGDLERFWMGHSDEEVGDLYSKIEEEADFCLKVAESVGLGFAIPEGKPAKVPEVVPIVPKIAARTHTR